MKKTTDLKGLARIIGVPPSVLKRAVDSGIMSKCIRTVNGINRFEIL